MIRPIATSGTIDTAAQRHADEIQALAALGSFVHELAEDRVEWSAEQLRIHGLDATRAPRALADFLECIHPEDQAHAQDHLAVLFRDGRDDCHYRIVRPDGGVRMLHSRSEVVYDDAGAAVRVVGTVQDVTRLWEAEQELRAANEQLEARVAERTAALRASEEHFRRLIEHAQDMVVVFDPVTGRHTYQTPSVQRILGYDPDEFSALDGFALVHPDDIDRVRAVLSVAVANPGTTHHAEYRYLRKDGTWCDLETFGSTLSATTAAEGMVFNTRDVTARKNAERALQQSEVHFRRLTENGNDLLMISDVDGALTYVSPSVTRILGYDPEVMIGFTPPRIVHPDDVDDVMATLRRVSESPGTAHVVNFRVRDARGEWRMIETINSTLLPDSTDAGIMCNCRDITAQRATESALRSAMADIERARADAERAREEAERTAARERLLADASRLLGASLDGATAMGRLAERIVPELANVCAVDVVEDERLVCVATVGALFEDETVLDASVDDASGGTLRTLRMSFGGRPGAADGWLTLARDVARAPFDAVDAETAAELAHRVGLALENARLFRAAQDAVAARDQVLAVVAHDLRSPLTAVRFDVEMLRADSQLEARVGATLARVERAAGRMDRLIEDLLDVARLGRGPLAMDRRPHDLNTLLSEAAASLRLLVEGHGLAFIAEAPTASPTVRVDGRRLLQALTNLVGNAVKFAPPDGRVWLRWDIVGGELRMAVRDDGPGIPPEQLPHIFGAFWQARHADTRGLGLGLAIARAIVEAHGGRIWVESVAGEGSTFVIALPLTEDAIQRTHTSGGTEKLQRTV